MQDFIKIHDNDKVVVALKTIPAGESLTVEVQGGNRQITALEEIPAGHKMAICDIPAGGEVIKYGYRIGNAKEDIRAGAWIHTHNIKTALGDLLEYTYEPVAGVQGGAGADAGPAEGTGARETAAQSGAGATEADGARKAVFMGFNRPDGSVGVRNEIWIIPTVGCVNNVATAIAREANIWRVANGEKYKNVGEVIAFPHPYGCSQMGDDQEHTRQILADLIRHPNAGGVLVLGLGCENSNIDVLKPYIGSYDENRVKFLVSQDCEDEIAESLEIIKGLIGYAAGFEREPVSVSRLVIGMKCGGSDGLSGITANPLVGRFSDRLISQGGTTILTEVPEMFGAETILMNRCADKELFDKTVNLINDFKNYFKSHNQTIYENPSPGNKKGGISTLEDKSLGCTQKSGSAPVRGVLQYGERVETAGLNLLSAPGNDLVAATALAAAGAHIVLFTTGRGTPFASPVPTVKISTNSGLAGRKSNWIDFNAGVLVEDKTMEEETEALFDYVVEVASGKQVRSEAAGFHDMAIFKQGVTL
ncbi:MAG: altronate dehydratase family protein [Firmicutes bacterium]|nr:altronate dehydratase family protein [Bacillota bacterium]